MGRNQNLGALGEKLVANYLIERKYKILVQNWRIREGEVDLIARKNNGAIVFVEVKTRTSKSYGDPLEAIDNKKAYRLQKLALTWLALNNLWGNDYQIDCASVLIQGTNPVIEYRERAL